MSEDRICKNASKCQAKGSCGCKVAHKPGMLCDIPCAVGDYECVPVVSNIVERIIAAHNEAYATDNKVPTDVFLGRKQMLELSEYALRVYSSTELVKTGTVNGMRIHETTDDSLIAVGWKCLTEV